MSGRAVIIVGASLAGATCALALARAGLPALVLERRRRVGDKVCGEGLQPAGAAVLAGLLPGLAAQGAPFGGFEFHLGTPGAGAPLAWDFPPGVRGLGLHRGRLEALLWRALAEEPLVELRTGCTLRALARERGGLALACDGGTLRAPWVVAADGVRSRLRASVETPWTLGRVTGRFGARARFAAAPAARVAVHFGPELEAYVTPLGPRLVSVALLGSGARVRAAAAAGFERALASFGARPEGPRVGPVQLWPHVGPRRWRTSFPSGARMGSQGGLFFAGDAACALDPISGAGMSLAAIGGALLARELAAIAGGGDPALAARRYDRDFRRCARPHRELTRLLRLLACSRALRRAAGLALRPRPEWIGRLARPVLAPPPGLGACWPGPS